MTYIKYLLFFVIIFFTHLINSITGFAGTVLSMPFGIMLVGYPVAKPLLNVFGLGCGVYVFLGNRRYVIWREVWRIVLIMGAGILVGIHIKERVIQQQSLMYLILGIFVILLSIPGLIGQFRNPKKKGQGDANAAGTEASAKAPVTTEAARVSPFLYLLPPIAGVVHGIFVSGGPLLIGYLAKRLPDKNEFRSTVSTIWIFLNGMVLVDDIRSGFWTREECLITLASVPFLVGGMCLGTYFYHKLSQRTFMILSYVLLLIMGLTLLLKV